jgi:hypothetical protein
MITRENKFFIKIELVFKKVTEKDKVSTGSDISILKYHVVFIIFSKILVQIIIIIDLLNIF